MDDLSNRMENYSARHFLFAVDGGVATLTLNRPERKNPLTFDACAELRDLFRALAAATDVKAVVLTGAGANFCSGGDVHDIIGPLTTMTMPALLDFTRLTGAVVQAMRACPQPVIAAIDGGCAGAGAMLALGSDLRYATARSQGRAAELLYTGRSMDGVEAERWGFVNHLCAPEAVLRDAQVMGAILAAGPTFAHAMTKKMLHQAWDMGVDAAMEADAQAQALCMATADFQRAYQAFAARTVPRFEGNWRGAGTHRPPGASALAVFRQPPWRAGAESRCVGRGQYHGRTRRRRRWRVPHAGGATGCGRVAAPCGAGRMNVVRRHPRAADLRRRQRSAAPGQCA